MKTITHCDGCNARFRFGQPSAEFGLDDDAGIPIRYRLCGPCFIAMTDDTEQGRFINARATAAASKRAHGVIAA
jgi:hypothetical protein